MAIISFVTTKPRRALIIKQPSFYYQKDKNGKVTAKRQIQYCPTLDTIFVDEQKKIDSNPKFQPIVIEKNILRIDDQIDPRKIDFLKVHEQFNKDFRLLDIESDSLYELEQFEKVDTASLAVKNANDNMVKALAMEFISPTIVNAKVPSQLKVMLIKSIRQNNLVGNKETLAEAVNSFISDKGNKEKLLVSVAVTEELIHTDGKKIVWSDSNEVIFIAPQAKDALKSFAVWLKNDNEGRQVVSALTSKLKNKED